MPVNYYFSGSGGHDNIPNLARVCPYRLLACHQLTKNYVRNWLDVTPTDGKNTILLDSGAFTAWTKGEEVLLPDLIETYYEMMSKYWTGVKEIYLINLDKIPGSPGITASNDEINECTKISDHNYNILKKEFGDRVLPVFHQGENEQRLKEIVGMGDYICVSPRNDLPERYRISWAKEIHSKIPPSIMTHGLATTGYKMLTQVPWTSVDSASWLMTCAMGGVNICINGQLLQLSISEKSPNRYTTMQHYNSMPELMKSKIKERIDLYGFTDKDLITNLYRRMDFTMYEILEWVNNHHFVELSYQNQLFEL
jgi:hypothetical protein